MDNNIREISLDSLRYDTAAKVRCGVDQATVDHYAELWKDYLGEIKADYSQGKDAADATPTVPIYPFPPINVAVIKNDDGETVYDCISGQHRARGAIQAGMEKIRIDITKAESDQWLKKAVSANCMHGRPYTSEDVKQCILSLRKESPKISCRDLAKLVGCSKSQANRVLNEMKEPDNTPLTTKAKKAGKAAVKPKKAEPEDDVIDESETPEEELLQLTPKWCDDVLDALQVIENPDRSIKDSLGELAVGIVKFLAQHGAIKSLQNRLVGIKSAK